jgi:hypothetical protein
MLNRKFLSTMAYVGRTPLVDVSGPASVLGAGPQNSYEYCYAFLAGECQPGSAIGDLFVNAPYVSYPYCYAPGIAQQDDDTNAICVGDLGAYTGNVVQSGFMQQDVVGAVLRRLGPNYSKWNQQDTYWNTDAAPSGLLSLSQVRWLDGVRFDDLLNILPPYPASDGIIRYTFLPVPVTVNPPTGIGAKSAVIAFGYAENGNPLNYYCTSRQESCVAAAAAINPTTPFYFASTESYSGVPCAQTCTITIPALSQHVVYYQVTYLGASGNVVGTSGPQAVATP